MCFKAVLELKKQSHNHLKTNLFNWKSKLLCCSSIGILSKLLHALLIFFTQNCPPLFDSIGTMGHTKTMIVDFFVDLFTQFPCPTFSKKTVKFPVVSPLKVTQTRNQGQILRKSLALRVCNTTNYHAELQFEGQKL